MKAKRCDRCGKFYLKNEKIPTNRHIINSYISGIAFLAIDRTQDASNDLCDECLDDLFDFLIYNESKQREPEEDSNDSQA